MWSARKSPSVVEFLSRDYLYKSIAIQIPRDARLTLNSYTGRKSSPIGNRTSSASRIMSSKSYALNCVTTGFELIIKHIYTTIRMKKQTLRVGRRFTLNKGNFHSVPSSHHYKDPRETCVSIASTLPLSAKYSWKKPDLHRNCKPILHKAYEPGCGQN